MTARMTARLRGRRALLAAPALCLLGSTRAHAAVPRERVAVLGKGINLTNWFRFPIANERASFEGWITNTEVVALRTAGFTHVRLSVHDDVVISQGRGIPDRLDLLRRQVQRLRAAGLATIVCPYMRAPWRPETEARDRERVLDFWRAVGPALSREAADATFAEVVNEGVFADQQAAWMAFLARAVQTIRQPMPGHTILVSPGNWAGIGGLRGFLPVADGNVVYSIHSYEPHVFATLASSGPATLDRAAIARLPWPINAPGDCAPALATADAATRDLVRWFCGGRSDRAWLRGHFAPMMAFGRSHDVPMHLGEFGVAPELGAPQRRAFLADVVAVMQETGAGWALWGFEDPLGLGRRRPQPGRPGSLDPAGILPALGLRAAGAT